MTIRKIVTLPNPILRKQTRKVTDFGEELQVLIDDMVETMRDAPGVGLAAPQVNVPLRIIVVEFGDEQDETVPLQLYTVVNPEIEWTSEETGIGVEGCLSVPRIVGEVDRPNKAIIHGLTRHGQATTLEAEGWLARIFQHEIDHLNGVLFLDKAVRIWKQEDQKPAEVSGAMMGD